MTEQTNIDGFLAPRTDEDGESEPLVSFDGRTVHEEQIEGGPLTIRFVSEDRKCHACGATFNIRMFEKTPVRLYQPPYAACSKCCKEAEMEWEQVCATNDKTDRLLRLVSDGKLRQDQLDCLQSDRRKEKGNEAVWYDMRNIDHGYQVTKTNWLILGPAGTGKTHCATMLMCKVARDYGSFLFITGARLDRHLKKFNPPESTENALLYSNVLVIDDMETITFDKESVLTGFWDLMDSRRGRCTIITSKLGGQEIFEWLASKSPEHSPGMGANALDRLQPYTKLIFQGDNLRRVKR